jgi:hypothetical protein
MNSSIRLLLGLLAVASVGQAATLILGNTGGDSRGTDSIDIQTARNASTEVASGTESVALGLYNTAAGNFNIALGLYNATSGTGIGEEFAMAVGTSNTVTGFAFAFGGLNTISNTDDGFYDDPSVAFGYSCVVSGLNSAAFGMESGTTGDHCMAVGLGVSNGTSNSLMIGPSNSAKVTILSSGYVGIGLGNTSPTQMLEVAGNIKTSGSVTAASDVEITSNSNGLILKSPNGTRFRITISNAGVLTATSL